MLAVPGRESRSAEHAGLRYAGGGTRTPKLFRALAPKASMFTNFITPACLDLSCPCSSADIPRRTISGWRRGESRGRKRMDCAGGLKPVHDFSKLDPQAYAYLLGLYLGDGCISAGRRGVWRLRITLDAAYPGVINECAVALEAIFPVKTAWRGWRRHSKCVDVSMWSKHWPCFFPQHGPGRKHLRPIRLEPWQELIVTANRQAFICGLIHSDGCRIIATERKGLLRQAGSSLCLQQQVRGHPAALL